ncbi:endolytic transglycosylase MltG [Alphaproteobacteria bacterium]|nr:endolytic transglycosylase MltG [Alphaproteobacteria bacterium]
MIEKIIQYPSKVVSLSNGITIEIPKYSSLSNIASILEDKGLIQSKYYFIIYSYFSGKAKALKAGEYYFTKNTSQKNILNKLYKNDVKLYKLVVPECYSNKQIFEIIKNNLHIGVSKINYSEGSLFPSTYYYSKDTSADKLLSIMHDHANIHFLKLYNKYKHNISEALTQNEVLILASIVEAEAKIKEEQSKIARVFLNRLKKGMKLQADPTVIYGINKTVYLDRLLNKSDLLLDHEWNTYIINSLPPTPICNVGIDAFKAVLNPEESNNLYFVADGKGGHLFSETYKEHKNKINLIKLNKIE